MKQNIEAHTVLNVLFLEDSPQDFEIARELLNDAGYDLHIDRVETKKEFTHALSSGKYNIILADFKLPGFDAFGALELSNEICPDVPFICVSGAIGEETAIELLKMGAYDYVLKDRPSRLPFAVKRAIEEANELAKRKQAEKLLLKSEQKFRSIFENAIEGIFQTTPEGRFLSINPSFAQMTGYSSPEEIIECITDLGHQLYVNPDDRSKFKRLIEEHGHIEGYEVQHYRKNGSTIWVSINARCVPDEHGAPLYYEGTFEDITQRKVAEQSLRQAFDRLRKSMASTIQAMSLTVEARDPYTAGHQKRVSDLAWTIAQEMRLSNDVIETIRMAGNVHDIGKISVPAEILSKSTKLTVTEFSLIKTHAQTGYNILKDAQLQYPIAEIVLQHHEKLDGSGYPQGLKGDQILLGARIVCVADVVEAITSHRPYRPALGIDVALAEIENNKKTFYDEHVVEACLKLFREKRFKFRTDEA